MHLLICEVNIFFVSLILLSATINAEFVQTITSNKNTFDPEQLPEASDSTVLPSLLNRNRRRVIFMSKSHKTNESDTTIMPNEDEIPTTTPNAINIMSILNVPITCPGKQKLDRYGRCRNIQS